MSCYSLKRCFCEIKGILNAQLLACHVCHCKCVSITVVSLKFAI